MIWRLWIFQKTQFGILSEAGGYGSSCGEKSPAPETISNLWARILGVPSLASLSMAQTSADMRVYLAQTLWENAGKSHLFSHPFTSDTFLTLCCVVSRRCECKLLQVPGLQMFLWCFNLPPAYTVWLRRRPDISWSRVQFNYQIFIAQFISVTFMRRCKSSR